MKDELQVARLESGNLAIESRHNSSLVLPSKKPVFVFLEILSCEGGIQSYVKDILQAHSADEADVFC